MARTSDSDGYRNGYCTALIPEMYSEEQ